VTVSTIATSTIGPYYESHQLSIHSLHIVFCQGAGIPTGFPVGRVWYENSDREKKTRTVAVTVGNYNI